jgi:AbrB family looped-hinge helix DNA binding protein
MKIKLREKRQMTLPSELMDALGLKPGDSLDARVEDGVIVLTPSRKAVLDALAELHHALEEAGITEEELIESGKKVREELVREKWPHLFPEPVKQG